MRRSETHMEIAVKKSTKLKSKWCEKYVYGRRRKMKEVKPKPVYFDLREPYHEWDFGITPDPLQCSHFGCGRELSLRERLFSDYCINHQDPDEKTIVAVNKYL